MKIMHKISFKPIKKNIIYISLISLFIGWYQLDIIESLPVMDRSVDLLVINTFNNLDIFSIKFVFPILIWLFPQLFLVYMLGSLLSNDLKNRAVYLFTRTNNRSSWFFSITTSLFLNTLLYYFIQYLLIILIGIVKNYEIKNLFVIFLSLILLVLTNFLLLLIINIFNLFFNMTFIYNIVLSVYIFLILITGIIGEYAPQYIRLIVSFPFSHALITWHDISDINYLQKDSSFYISRFSIKDSLIYIFLLITLSLFITVKKIKKMDLI